MSYERKVRQHFPSNATLERLAGHMDIEAEDEVTRLTPFSLLSPTKPAYIHILNTVEATHTRPHHPCNGKSSFP